MCKRVICLISVLLLASSAVASAATPGPVGWWKFDETTGTTAADSVGGNNGTLINGPTWAAGKIGGALLLDGTDDYVDLSIGNLINTLESTTFSVWVNWAGSSSGSWQRIFDFGSGTSIYAFLAANRGGTDSPRFAMRSATVGEQIVTAPATLASGWHHLAVAIDSAAMNITLFVDGAAVATSATTILPKDMGVTTQNWVAKSQYTADAYYKGIVDELRIYDRALSQAEVANVMQGGLGYGIANAVSPADKAVNLLPDVTLSWKAGQLGQTHDVYLGTSSDAVAAATTVNPMGVLLNPSQTTTTYNAGRLELGKTYYWRVDEVGAAPDYTVYKGNVWSFTIEPYAYTMGKSSITATASSSTKDMGPEKTIDGSGLNAAGQHSTKETDMWLSLKGGAQPTWIQYAFDKVYSLDMMLVWNSNQALETVVGYGAKDVTVEYSIDGTTWTKLGDKEFTEAPGDATCTADTQVAFGGAAAKFVKLTINNNWGGVLAQYGLSEVRFSYIPVSPTELSPASGTLNLDSPVTLSWRPGRQAVTHEVYLGTDAANMPLAATTDKTSYVAKVAVGSVYYWKVVEVNEAAATPRWESDVANFSTVAVPTNPGTTNLKHQYTFDDGTVKDSVGKADGTLVGGAAVVDGALVTSAQDQWMEMPGKTIAMNTYEAVTMAMWYTPKANGNTGYTMLAYFGDSVGGLGSNGYFMCSARGDNISRTAISIGNTLAPWSAESGANGPEYDDGKPHCMISVMDATTIKLYIDGVLISSANLSAANKISGISQNLAYLAKGGYTGDPEWIGAIHEFRVYNKAVSAGEALYLSQLLSKDPGTGNLKHQYTFEDGTAKDSVGAANGVLVGGATVTGGALVTSAQGQSVELPAKTIAMNTYEAVSLAMWYTPKANGNTGYTMLAYFGDSVGGLGSNGYFFSPARGDNVSRTAISVGNTSAPWSAESGANGPEYDDGKPHFVVSTMDATTIKLYVDSVLTASTALSAANKISGISQNLAYLCKGGYTGDPTWIGSLGEFRIYNKALNAGEVRFLAGQR